MGRKDDYRLQILPQSDFSCNKYVLSGNFIYDVMTLIGAFAYGRLAQDSR
jgi:hypothetical protein